MYIVDEFPHIPDFQLVRSLLRRGAFTHYKPITLIFAFVISTNLPEGLLSANRRAYKYVIKWMQPKEIGKIYSTARNKFADKRQWMFRE